MNTTANQGYGSLTEKEKQTLRLIVRGHDVKSTARSLGLSVHTINERLRDARRKMSVSSSREAARLLLEVEHGNEGSAIPNFPGHIKSGEDLAGHPPDEQAAPIIGAGRSIRRLWIIIGGLSMVAALGLLALIAIPQAGSPPSHPETAASQSIPDVLNKARSWLRLVDEGRWDESYQATGSAFRKLNTAQTWAAVSERVRTPLGAVLTRTFLSEENLPAPPYGYEVVKFRTSFANKSDTVETVTLERESGVWRVVGVTIG
jgi:DNA-binding CsgD family transcriptional regulator